MNFDNCTYDPVRDLHEVEPFGYVDLKNAFVTNTVPTQMPDADVQYNGIDNPESILGKPQDVFDALSMESAINNYSKDATGECDKNEK